MSQIVKSQFVRRVFVPTVLSLLTTPSWGHPARYAVTSLGSLPGYSISQAYGINNRGQIIGYVATKYDITMGFIYSGGKMRPLGDFLDSYPYESWAGAISDRAEVTGSALSTGGDLHAIVYQHGKLSDLGTLLGLTDFKIAKSYGLSINDGGEITGASDLGQGTHLRAILYRQKTLIDLNSQIQPRSGWVLTEGRGINKQEHIVGVGNHWGRKRAFLYAGGKVQELVGLSPAGVSAANAINDHDQMAGSAVAADGRTHAVLWSGRKTTDLGGLPGYRSSIARAVNDLGQVVGDSAGTNQHRHAFVFTRGRMSDLNSLIGKHSGWILQKAYGINDKGQIVGSGKHRRKTHAFLLIPQ